MKKLFSLALALVMIFALATTAMADGQQVAEDYTITITTPDSFPAVDNDSDDEVYAAYKIFDATYEGEVLGENAKIAYTIDSANNPFYDTIAAHPEWFTLTKVNTSSVYVVEPKAAYNEAAAIALADLLKVVVDAKQISSAAECAKDGNNFKLTVEDKGYYFITSTLGSDIIVDTLSDIEIQSKNDYPTIAKEADLAEARFGDTITYTLTITVPDSVDKTITVTDTMEAGLTFIENEQPGAGVTFANNGQVNTVTVAPSCAGSTVTVTYTAYINTAEGEIYTELNTNTAYLEYSEYKSATVKADVASYEATFKKIDGATKAGLAGVTFKLTEEDGVTEIPVILVDGVYRVVDKPVAGTTYATITTDADGKIEIEGLNSDKYALVELSTLAGYNLLEGPYAFEIDEANNYYGGLDTEAEADDNNIIINNSGLELPSTGGVGTTIFTVVGALLMGAAFILFVTKKKMANEQ